MTSALFPETGMTHHFRATALFTLIAIISLVIPGCGSAANSAPGTPATGTSAATCACTSDLWVAKPSSTRPRSLVRAAGLPSAP